MRGRNVVLGLVGAVILLAGFLFWVGMTGGSQHVPGSAPGVGFMKSDAGSNDTAAETDAGGASDGGPITKTLHDRRVREQLRERLLAAWAAQGDPEVATAAKHGRFVPAPTGDGGGAMDPGYIQGVIRQDFMPMAAKCYEELLTRKDAGGRIEMSFTIVADEKEGAIVENVEVDADGGKTIADEKMATCMRESMSTLAFRPPAHGGYVTVVYPFEFSP